MSTAKKNDDVNMYFNDTEVHPPKKKRPLKATWVAWSSAAEFTTSANSIYVFENQDLTLAKSIHISIRKALGAYVKRECLEADSTDVIEVESIDYESSRPKVDQKTVIMNNLGKYIRDTFSEVSAVEAIYLLKYGDELTIITLLESNDKDIRYSIYERQSQVYDAFPDAKIEFNLSFNEDYPDGFPYPAGAHNIFKR